MPEHKVVQLKRPLTDDEYERVARRFGWTSTDPNGYSSVFHTANPNCYDKTCERCGKIAAWSAGSPPEHYLCLECTDAWGKLDVKFPNHGWLKVWEIEFKKFIEAK
jgi:hypothetical protein